LCLNRVGFLGLKNIFWKFCRS